MRECDLMERCRLRRDPEEAPVLARCECCGAEIYSRRELDMYDGICEDCARALEEEDDGRGSFGFAQDDRFRGGFAGRLAWQI